MSKARLVASIDVDAQKTFTPLCPNELPVPEGEKIGPALNALAAYADLRVMTKDAHSAQAPWVVDSPEQMLQALDLENADVTWVAHAVPGTTGFELLDELPSPLDYDYRVYKGIEPDLHPYGACYHDLQEQVSTGLIEWLNYQNVGIVLLGGLALDYCVKTTALQLKRAGFDVVVVLEACRGIASDTSETAKTEMLAANIQLCEQICQLPALLASINN